MASDDALGTVPAACDTWCIISDPLPFGGPKAHLGFLGRQQDRWLSAGFYTAPLSDPAFGAGVDLGGVLWGHDPASRGRVTHQPNTFLCDLATDSCTFADNFTFGAAPNPPATKVTKTFYVPVLIGGCGCAACGSPSAPYPYCAPPDPSPLATITLGNADRIFWGLDGGQLREPGLFGQARALAPEPGSPVGRPQQAAHGVRVCRLHQGIRFGR